MPPPVFVLRMGCANGLQHRAEPSRAEPSRAEPSRAEPSRAEPSRAEPSRRCTGSLYTPGMMVTVSPGSVALSLIAAIIVRNTPAHRPPVQMAMSHRIRFSTDRPDANPPLPPGDERPTVSIFMCVGIHTRTFGNPALHACYSLLRVLPQG
jgi:hypothetical protein